MKLNKFAAITLAGALSFFPSYARADDGEQETPQAEEEAQTSILALAIERAHQTGLPDLQISDMTTRQALSEIAASPTPAIPKDKYEEMIRSAAKLDIKKELPFDFMPSGTQIDMNLSGNENKNIEKASLNLKSGNVSFNAAQDWQQDKYEIAAQVSTKRADLSVSIKDHNTTALKASIPLNSAFRLRAGYNLATGEKTKGASVTYKGFYAMADKTQHQTGESHYAMLYATLPRGLPVDTIYAEQSSSKFPEYSGSTTKLTAQKSITAKGSPIQGIQAECILINENGTQRKGSKVSLERRVGDASVKFWVEKSPWDAKRHSGVQISYARTF